MSSKINTELLWAFDISKLKYAKVASLLWWPSKYIQSKLSWCNCEIADLKSELLQIIFERCNAFKFFSENWNGLWWEYHHHNPPARLTKDAVYYGSKIEWGEDFCEKYRWCVWVTYRRGYDI